MADPPVPEVPGPAEDPPGQELAPRPKELSLTRATRGVLADTLRQFETSIGGRAALIKALAVASSVDGVDPAAAQYVVGLLADPKNADKSLARIAQLGGITLQDLLKLYRHGAVQRAHLAAGAAIVETLPAAAAHAMARSVPYEADCERCSGLGQTTPNPTTEHPNPSPVTCPQCRGGGRLRYEPTLDQQKLALTLGGLLKGGGGVNVTVNAPQAPQVLDDFTRMQKRNAQALSRRGWDADSTDAEIIDGDSSAGEIP